MTMDKFFESNSNELGQEPFAPLEGELFDFEGEFFDFETACNDGAVAPEQMVEDMSQTFFEDACFYNNDLEHPLNSNKSSGDSFEFEETLGTPASDISSAGFGSNDIFAGLSNDTFGLAKDFDFGEISDDEFRWPSKATSVAELTANTQPATKGCPTPSKRPNILTKPAKVVKASKKPKKTATPKRELLPKIPRERTVKELSTVPWGKLTQKEREKLLRPWIRGTDPVTGAKVPSSDKTFTESIFKTFGLDLRTGKVETQAPAQVTPAPKFSSPYEALTVGIKSLTDDEVVEYLIELAISEGYDLRRKNLPPGTKRFTADFNPVKTINKSGTQTANTSTVGTNNSATIRGFGSTNINTTAPAQRVGYPNNNGSTMPQVFKMPTPPSVYGSTRQQEALHRSAQLQAQGRRR